MSGFHYLGAPDFTDNKMFIRPLHITAIGEVLEDGLTASALRIEYSGELEAGQAPPAYFQVPGRRVIQTYVNNTGKRREAAPQGRFLFLELLVNRMPDSNEFRETPGQYRYTRDGGAWALALPMVLAVRQTGTIFCNDGRAAAPFNKANDDQYIEIVDDMLRQTYHDADTSITMPYNLYVPAGYETKSSALQDIPLVFFLHGAGESGFDNMSPASSYRQALEFCAEKAQAESPCFLMIPQCPVTEERDGGMFEEFGWYTYINHQDDDHQNKTYTHPSKSLKAAVNALVGDVLPAYNIDHRRIYAVGHSMGGGGSLAALFERPDLFAAALSFSSAAVFSDDMLTKIKNKPVFFTMAQDDEYDFIRNNMPRMMDRLEKLGTRVYRDEAWDAALRGEAAKQQADTAIAKAARAGASMIYVEFIKGSVVPAGHLSHRASFENAGIRHWLFEQRLGYNGPMSFPAQ